MPIRKFNNFYPTIAATVYVDPLALVVGQVTLEEQSSLWPMAVVRGDVQRIVIGACTNIQDSCVLHVSHDSHYCPGGRALLIGEKVTVGHHVNLHACTVEHHCLIGIGAIVLDDAVIQPYTLIAAGSLVPPRKVLEGGYLWRGNPVERVRALTAEEKAYFDYSANHYVKLAQQYKG